MGAALEASAKTETAVSLARPLPRRRPAIAAALADIFEVVGYLLFFSGPAVAVSSVCRRYPEVLGPSETTVASRDCRS